MSFSLVKKNTNRKENIKAKKDKGDKEIYEDEVEK